MESGEKNVEVKKRDIQMLKHKKASDEDHSWKLNLTLCLRNSGLAKSIQKICFNKNIYESSHKERIKERVCESESEIDREKLNSK